MARARRAGRENAGDGTDWLTGCISLPDRTGKPHLVASYEKVKPPLEAYEWGLCVWNDDTSNFERFRMLWTKQATTPKPRFAPRASGTLERCRRQGVGVIRQPAPTPPLSGHLRGLAGCFQLGGANSSSNPRDR